MAEPDLLAPFDPETIAAVAADCGVDAEALRERLCTHQRTARSVRAVDGLVYEYRRAFPGEVVRERTSAAYYLSVPERVWGEFEADAVDAVNAERTDAVRAVHERTLAAAVDEKTEESTGDDGGSASERRGEPRAAMVLVRE